MGLIATAKVVIRAKTSDHLPLLQPVNQEWVTVIKLVNSAEWALPPCIIFKGKAQLQAWYKNNTLPHDWRIEISLNKWTTDKINISWLQNLFIPYTNNWIKKKYWMLVLDKHKSYLTPQFDHACAQNHIISICMLPHSSHLLQPLDVGCFAVLKHTYGHLVEDNMQLGINYINKLDFLTAYPKACTEAFKSENIKNGFAAARLVPFCPDWVLIQLNIQLKTLTPSGSCAGSILTN